MCALSEKDDHSSFSPAPPFTPCGTHPARSWLDSGLCTDGLYRLLLTEVSDLH